MCAPLKRYTLGCAAMAFKIFPISMRNFLLLSGWQVARNLSSLFGVPLPGRESAPAATTNVQKKMCPSLPLSLPALARFFPGAPALPAKPSANHTGCRATVPQALPFSRLSLSVAIPQSVA